MARAEAAAAEPHREGRWRSFVTPEGVDLGLRLADAGERAGAFLIDAMIIVVTLVVVTLLAVVGGIGGMEIAGVEVVAIVWLLAFFLLRNGYFAFFEMRPRGATPGKRMLGLRVASRDGGRLDADAVLARNAMREVEVFLPATLLLSNAGDVDGWVAALGLVWCGVFIFFPLFNRDRLRAGDVLAGTWVVKAPKLSLLHDLAERRGRVEFSAAEADAYGVRELHVLEEVLRARDRRAMGEAAAAIRRKLGRVEDAAASDAAFLEAYYAALRQRLEAQLLLGRRRRDKHDR
jgi:uncharacterized RDD family membrane protein YckC